MENRVHPICGSSNLIFLIHRHYCVRSLYDTSQMMAMRQKLSAANMSSRCKITRSVYRVVGLQNTSWNFLADNDRAMFVENKETFQTNQLYTVQLLYKDTRKKGGWLFYCRWSVKHICLVRQTSGHGHLYEIPAVWDHFFYTWINGLCWEVSLDELFCNCKSS